MPAVLTLFSAKGGVGKTTTATHVAADLAFRGIDVRVLDADLNSHASRFGEVFCLHNPTLPIKFVADVNKDNFRQAIKNNQDTDLIILDLPAGTSELSLRAMMASNLVVIPTQPTPLDLRDAARTIIHVNEASEETGRRIYSSVLWSRITGRFESRTERATREQFSGMLVEPGRAFLRNGLTESDALRAAHLYGFTPAEMETMTGWAERGEERFFVPASTGKAAENIRGIASEILGKLEMIAGGGDPGWVELKPELV